MTAQPVRQAMHTQSPGSKPLYIAIEGPIGVGKTTLVNRLNQRLDASLVLEVVEENPFLPSFYEDPDRFAFQTQLFFLMSRFRQQSELLQGDLFRPNLLADYHLLKDRIFARLTLKDDELALYERVYQSLERHILQPDVLVYLHAPIQTLLDRIEERGRPFESNFDREYLENLCTAYQHYFAHQTAPCRVLFLDNSNLDYARSDDALELVFQSILKLASQESGTAKLRV